MGKTTLLIKLLKFFWLNKFNKIYIFCPTYAQDSKWSDLDAEVKTGKISVHPEVKDKLLKKIWNQCSKKKLSNPNYHTMILMDDCVGQPDFKTHSDQGILNKIVCKGNHLNITTVWSVQKITNVSPTMRLQVEALLAFYISDMREKKSLYQEFGAGTWKQFQVVLEKSTEQPFHYLYMKRQGPGKPKFYHNFRLINPKLLE
jgi:hypothetical protein